MAVRGGIQSTGGAKGLAMFVVGVAWEKNGEG